MTTQPPHPDVGALDEYVDRAGSGRPASAAGRRGDPVADHVAGCVDCTETVDALRQVRADLARLGPVEMPVEVADRLSAAIRTEAGSTVLPSGRRTSRRRGASRPRTSAGWLGVAAAAVLVVVGVGLGLLAAHDHGTSRPVSSGALGRAASSAPSVSSATSGSPDAGAGESGGAAAPRAVQGGLPAYDRTTVARLAAAAPAGAVASVADSGTGACLRRIAGTGTVALVRTITFEGSTAVAGVLRPAGGGPARVVVLDPACTPDDVARFLRYSTDAG